MPVFLAEAFMNKMLTESTKHIGQIFTIGGVNKCRENILLNKVEVVTDKIEKYNALLILSINTKRAIMFVKTQIICDEIGSDTDSKLHKDNNIYLLHAGRSVEERSQVVDEYKQIH